MQDKLEFVYEVCLWAGIVITVINAALGGIGTIFDIDFDLDGDTNFDCPLPININCILLACVIFGSIGKLASMHLAMWVGFTLALVSAAIGYILLFRFVIIPLKRNNSEAFKIGDIKGKIGTVCVSIPRDGMGKVEFSIEGTGRITYFAMFNSTDFDGLDEISIGTKVVVIGLKKESNDTLLVALTP